QAEDGIRDFHVTGVQTCALPISPRRVVLLAHSLAVATTVKWAEQANEASRAKVLGALLVAPTNVANPDPSFDLVRPFAPMPMKKIGRASCREGEWTKSVGGAVGE